MSLNRQNLENQLQQSIPNLYLFDQVGSTNQVVWDLWKTTQQTPIIAMASQQTAGRGQWGRNWVSGVGGLYVSIGLTLEMLPQNAPHLTLLSAWGVAQNLRRFGLPVKLKWPNDMLLQGKKLGGIKSETRIQQQIITHCVIGVGINWSNVVPHPGITIESYGQPHDIDSLETLAALTINGVLQGYDHYLSNGIDHLLKNYIEILDSVGRKVIIEGMAGTIVGVSTQGELKVCLQAPGSKTTLTLPPGTLSLGYSQGEDIT